jgi:hypothetical protein
VVILLQPRKQEEAVALGGMDKEEELTREADDHPMSEEVSEAV